MQNGEEQQVDAPAGDEEGLEGGKTAPGETPGTRGQLDSASGGYGSQSGSASSGGTGEGEPVQTEAGQPGAATGATGEAPTDWLRRG